MTERQKQPKWEHNDQLRRIKEIYPKYKQLKDQYNQQENFIREKGKNLVKAINSHKTDRVSRRTKAFKALVSVQFKSTEFWLNTLVNYYESQIVLISERIHLQVKQIQSLNDLYKEHNQTCEPFRLQHNKLKSFPCTKCTSLMLLCNQCASRNWNQTEWVHPELSAIPKDAIIAVDVESANRLKASKGQSPQIAIRVSAVTNFTLNKKIETKLIYHSYWNTDEKIYLFKPITGLTVQEMRNNRHRFANRIKAKNKFVNEVIRNRTVVFAAALGDLKALDLKTALNYFDIQSYYVRYPERGVLSQEPVNLKDLAKYVLNFPIQDHNNATFHNPVVDAAATLKLFYKIPSELRVPIKEMPSLATPPSTTCNSDWLTNESSEISFEGDIQNKNSQPLQLNTAVTTNSQLFQEIFEPDYEI